MKRYHPLMTAQMSMRTKLISPRNNPLWLHHLRINYHEDGLVLVPGRAVLPAKHRGTLRQRLHMPEMGAPPVAHYTKINYL